MQLKDSTWVFKAELRPGKQVLFKFVIGSEWFVSEHYNKAVDGHFVNNVLRVPPLPVSSS